MAGVFLKLAVFVTLSLHCVAAQGTTPSAAPSLVITPTSYSVDYGSTVLMTCVAYLGPDTEDHSSAAISWTDPAGQALSNDTDSMVTIYSETQTQNGLVFLESILEICSVGVSHSGQFSCRAANSNGSESFSWNITFTEEITAPQLVITPVNQDVNYGDTVLMACVASGFPQPEITWSRNGVLLDPASSDLITIYTETVSEVGLNFTESILEICGVGTDDIGSFTCTATSDAGTATSTPFTVGILPNSTEVALVITPSSDTVEVHSTVLLVCVAQGDPTPSISWDFEGSIITNETSDRHTVYDEAVTQGNLMFVQSILEICSIEEAEGGDYTCNATNGLISETNTTTITVVDDRVIPTIVVSPNVTDPLTEGDTVALACTATGRPYPTIQWYKDGVLLTNESLTTIYNEEVEQNGLLFTTSILEVCSVGADDRGSYRCVASNSLGNDSFDFDIQVMLGEATVVISPVDYTIDESATMVAVCVGTGFPEPSISWSLDGYPLENSSRVTIYEEVIEESGITFVQSFLEVCSVDFMDAGLYQCTVANRLVNASSNFTLTVSRVGEPPQLVVAPNASLEVDAGATVTYVCVGYGEDEPPNIIWEFGDQLLSNDTSSLVTIYESQLMENRLVFTQSILELCSVEVENAGNYSCTANNSRGSNSSIFTLNIRPRIAPTIVIRPNVTDPFTEGDTVSLVCTATGRPYATIQWYKDGTEITNGSLTSIYNEQFEGNGLLFTSSILEVCSVSADDRGTYSCVANNLAGNDSVDFEVQVRAAEATVVISPVDYTIDESTTMVAVCVGTGFPQPSISWSLDGAPLENSSRVSIYEEVIEESGITFVQSFLEVCSVDSMDAGLYQCTVANRLVNASSNFTLTVNTVGEPAQIVIAPNASIEVDAGTTVTYVCVGYGEDEPPNIIWEFGDQLLSNDTSSLVTIYDSRVVENGQVFTQSILELCSVEVENAGNYSCTANNSRGSNSSTFTLNVRPRVAPTIVIRPNVTDPFTEGDTVSLVCTATGRPYATIQWYKDGTEITNGSLTSIYNEQFEGYGLVFTSSILEVCSVGPDDRGTYSCVASNLVGNDSVDFEVQVRAGEANVVIAPTNYTIDEMTTFVAVCVGTGFPQPTISWSQNGNQLENDSRITITEEVMVESGITFVQSFLEVCSVDFMDAGLYQCTVANRIVNASTYFTLTVNRVGEHPQIVISPNASIEVDAGTTVTYVCVGYGEDEPPNIIWEFGDQLLSNDTSSLVTIYDSQVVENGLVFTQSILELCSVEIENAGSYSCTANNSRGSNSSTFTLNVINIATIIVAPPSNVFVRGGETIMIVCAGVGSNPELSWSRGGDPVTNATDDRVTIYEEFGMQGNTRYIQSILEICSTQESDEGVYECTLTSRTLSSTVNFTLSVNSTPATIIIGPADTFPIFNSSVFLTCVATGYPLPTVTWYRDGEQVDDPDNIQSEVIEERGEQFVQSTLLVCSVQETARYNCSVSNGISGEAVTSVSVNVVVEVPVTITAQPTNSTLLVNGDAIFTCSAYGTAPIDLTWYRVDSGTEGAAPTRIDDNRVTHTQTGSTEITVVSNLTLASVGTADDGAMFYCEATNNLTEAGVFTNQSDSATLTVQSVPVITTSSPKVIGLVNTEVTIGITIEDDYPVIMETQITWYHQRDLDTPLTSTIDSRYVFSSGMQSLTINQLTYADEGNYTIIVSHVTGSQTIIIQIDVQKGAMIVGGPRSTAVPIGQSASFSCNVTGEPMPIIVWQFNGGEITESSKYTISSSSSGGIFTSVLTVSALMTNDTGIYICYAENDHLNETASAMLTVQTPPIVSAEASLTETLLGEDFKVVFAISNDIPQVSPSDISWTFTSSLSGLETALDDSADPRLEFSSDMLTLTVMSVSLLDDGVYTVRARNPAGSDSDYTRIAVYAAPYINSTGRDETMMAGGRVSFSCFADGVPTPSISWFKDSTFISTESVKKFDLTESTIDTGLRENINETLTSVLSIVGITESDAGLYTCSASSSRGSTAVLSPPFNLTVTPAPLPDFCDPNPCQNGGICESGPLTYICKCTGTFKGTNCDEAIIERSAPRIEKGPQTTFVGIYSSVNLTCVVSGSPQPSIQWYKDNAPLPGEVYPSYYIQSVELDDRGVYHCEAMNSEGSVVSNEAVINILGIQQYTVDLFIPLVGFGVSTFSDEVVETSRSLVNDLNERLAGRVVSGVLIFSVTPEVDDKFVTHDPATNLVKISLVLTVLVLPGDIFGRNLFPGETLITPEVLNEFTDVITDATDDLGYEANVTRPARLDGCATEQTPFNPANTNERTLTWAEAAIGAVATSPCPCGELEIGREATRVCMGNFTTRGEWGEPDYSNCEFTQKTWQLCDAIEEGIATVLSLTGTPDPDSTDHLEIVVSTQYIEREMGSASGNEMASNQLLDLINNLLQYPDQALKNAHEEFNTSARMMAALDRLSDSYPVVTNPRLIVKGMYVIIIYDSLSPQTFNGQVVFANIGAEFTTDAFNRSHISFDSFDGTPTASIGLPRSLLNGRSGDHRIVFNFFLSDGFFIRRDSYITENNLQNDKLGGLAVAAHIAGGVKVTDLSDPVNMTFTINPKYRTGGNTTCSFWDQSLDNSYGGWSSRGCKKISGSIDNVLCHCTHLTSFGLVVDTSPRPTPRPLSDSSIGRITTLGPVVLLLLALVVIFSYLISNERSSQTSVFLINFCVSLVALCVCYIVSTYAMANNVACQFFSFLLHFTLLVSAGAMAIMLFFMIYAPYTGLAKRIAITAAITTNLLFSVVITIISIAPSPDNYFSEEFCRPSSYPYWFGLLLVGGIEMLVTAVLFMVATILRKRQPRSKDEDKSYWIEFFGLFFVFVLFYIAWGFGLPAVHPLNLGPVRVIFQVIFIIATIALGVVMLTFFCILSSEIRDAWKSKFGRFVPGHSKKANIGERRDIEDNLYLTNRSAAGSNLKEEAVKDVSFTFTGNIIKNPIANEYDEIKPATEKKAKEADDGDTDSYVKLDLAALSEDTDDQKQSTL